MLKTDIYSTFTIAIVTKMAKNRLKIEKLPFWTKFKALEIVSEYDHRF